MSTHKSRKTVVEREGVNYLRSLVEGSNCIFHEIHRENDFGNDAIIEFVENENVKGLCVAVQVKSGDSYCTSTSCSIPADKAHFEYWRGHSLPIIGVVYDPQEALAYWTSITAYLQENPKAFSQGPYTITFKKDDLSRLDRNSITTIFLPRVLQRPVVLDFDQSKDWAEANDFEKHTIGVTSLLFAHRDKRETWDIFIELLRNREPSNTNRDLIYCLALIPGHMDIFWSSHNSISPEVKIYVHDKISRFMHSETVRLLSYIDEYGIDRGTVGQNVSSIIGLVINRRQILEDIALDEKLDMDLRTRAVMAFFELERKGVALLLSRLLDSDEPMRKYARQVIRNFSSAWAYETE